MTRTFLIAAMLALAGCVQIPPTPEEIQSKKFASVPDKAVIYIVRNDADSGEAGALLLDDTATLTTYRRTYYRWEVAPGAHRVAGFAGDHSALTLDARAGRIYFVEYTVHGTRRSGWQFTNLREVGDRRGHALVQGARLL